MTLHPDQPLKCLLIQPKFSETNYWNFVASAKAIGAKATAPPLGLLTVAAMLPQNWQMEVVDLNVGPMSDEQWNSADIICTGGMLPQQGGILALIERANKDGKYVVVGGPGSNESASTLRACKRTSLRRRRTDYPDVARVVEKWRANWHLRNEGNNGYLNDSNTPFRFDQV